MEKEPNYSFTWSRNVFYDFKKKYPRATDYLRKMYGIGDEVVVYWIAKSPNRWKNYKRGIKIFHAWDKKEPFDELKSEEQLNARIVLFKWFLKKHVFKV